MDEQNKISAPAGTGFGEEYSQDLSIQGTNLHLRCIEFSAKADMEGLKKESCMQAPSLAGPGAIEVWGSCSSGGFFLRKNFFIHPEFVGEIC